MNPILMILAGVSKRWVMDSNFLCSTYLRSTFLRSTLFRSTFLRSTFLRSTVRSTVRFNVQNQSSVKLCLILCLHFPLLAYCN